MNANGRLDIRSRARELKNIAAAEAKAHGRSPCVVTDRPLVSSALQGLHSGVYAPASLWRVISQCVCEGRGLRRTGGYFALAIHISDEGYVLLTRHFSRACDCILGHTQPIRCHQQQRSATANALVIDQRATTTEAATLILDCSTLTLPPSATRV